MDKKKSIEMIKENNTERIKKPKEKHTVMLRIPIEVYNELKKKAKSDQRSTSNYMVHMLTRISQEREEKGRMEFY